MREAVGRSPRHGSHGKEPHRAYGHINGRNEFAANKENGISRRQTYRGDDERNAVYMAFDRKCNLVVFL